MECVAFGERVNRYIDGELGYVEVAELQRHLSFCPHCAAELAAMSEVRGAMAEWGGLELALPRGFAERVMAAVELEPLPGSPRPIGEVVDDVLRQLDETLGRLPLPGGRTVPVRSVIGWGLAVAAVLIGLERRYVRHEREPKASHEW
jgi:anti-sigma factor RsiW